MALSQRAKSILAWVFTIGGGIGLGAVAARFRLLESIAVLFGLCVVCALVAALGFWGMWGLSRPWNGDDD
ncbi:MAG TPA: hypothetical protein VGX68_02130 [Thermoanaerobaculia bacterium]|jgi:hypothetical protein|nr:hypothetical protein [Thermoanaerobaculia bacterium]